MVFNKKKAIRSKLEVTTKTTKQNNFYVCKHLANMSRLYAISNRVVSHGRRKRNTRSSNCSVLVIQEEKKEGKTHAHKPPDVENTP